MKSSYYSELFDAVGRVIAQHGMTDCFVGLVLDYCTFAGHSRLRYIFMQLGQEGILQKAASVSDAAELESVIDEACCERPDTDRVDVAAAVLSVGVASGIVTADRVDEYFSDCNIVTAEEPQYEPVEIEFANPEPSQLPLPPYATPPAPPASPKGKVPATNNAKKVNWILIGIVAVLISIAIVCGGIILGNKQAHDSDEVTEIANTNRGITAVKPIAENDSLVQERKKQGNKLGFRNLPLWEQWDKAMAAVDADSNFLQDDLCKPWKLYKVDIKRADSLMKTFADTELLMMPHSNSDNQMNGKLKMGLMKIDKDEYYCLLYEDKDSVRGMSITTNPFVPRGEWELDSTKGVFDEFHRLYGEPEVYHPGEYVWTYPEMKIVINRSGAYFIPRIFSGLLMW